MLSLTCHEELIGAYSCLPKRAPECANRKFSMQRNNTPFIATPQDNVAAALTYLVKPEPFKYADGAGA